MCNYRVHILLAVAKCDITNTALLPVVLSIYGHIMQPGSLCLNMVIYSSVDSPHRYHSSGTDL